MKYLLACIMVISMMIQLDSKDIAKYTATEVMATVHNYSPDCKAASCG
jgi:hypothetical protein